MFALTTQVVRKPVRFPELEDPTKQIDLNVLEEHIRRSKRTFVLSVPRAESCDDSRATLRFRAMPMPEPVYPIARRRLPLVSLAVATMILAAATTWMLVT